MLRHRDGGKARSHLDLRLQARALVLGLQPQVTRDQAVAALVAMAGGTAAGPIATRRAMGRVHRLHLRQPSERTTRALESLDLALARVLAANPPHAVAGPDLDAVDPFGASQPGMPVPLNHP